MYKSIKLRLYPTEEQKKIIKINIDNARAVYNWALDIKQFAYSNFGINLSRFDLRRCLTRFINSGAMAYLKSDYSDSSSYDVEFKCLIDAYEEFFAGRSRHPGYRRKKSRRQSYTSHSIHLRVENGKVKMPRLGYLTVRGGVFKAEGKHVLRSTVSIDKSGQYFVSVMYEEDDDPYIEEDIISDNIVGIDVGLRTMCTFSDGTKINPPNAIYRNLKKLRRLSKRFDRQSRSGHKGSNRHEKMRKKLAKVYIKIHNQRIDYVHKLTTNIVRTYDEIHIEDYNTDNWRTAATPYHNHLNRKIIDACLGMFKNQLQYKCNWYHKKLVIADKGFPSTQLCSNCGYRHKEVSDPKYHSWICPNCGAEHDRDINAAINLKEYPNNPILAIA